MDVGKYVKAEHNFLNPELNEIPLNAGDIVNVTQKINNDWLKGINITQKSQEGNFPSNYVSPVLIPVASRGEKVFAGVAAFNSEVIGDLPFEKGDIIIGISPVDANWWNGRKDGIIGIFPLTHVVELKVSEPSQLPAVSQKPLPVASKKSQNCDEKNNKNKPSVENISVSVPNTSESKTSSQSSPCLVVARVRAALSLTAQLPEELSFCEGDEIEIVKILDDDFAVGRLNGEMGQLPLAFVDVLEGSIKFEKPNESTKKLSKFEWWKEPSAEQSILQKSPVSYEKQPTFEEQTAPIGLEDELENMDQVVGTTEEINGNYTDSNNYAVALYTFDAVNDNELSISQGQVVKIIGRIDEGWTEGMVDDKRGIFPTSFVQFIDDASIPYENNEMFHSNSITSSVDSDSNYPVFEPCVPSYTPSALNETMPSSHFNGSYIHSESINEHSIKEQKTHNIEHALNNSPLFARLQRQSNVDDNISTLTNNSMDSSYTEQNVLNHVNNRNSSIVQNSFSPSPVHEISNHNNVEARDSTCDRAFTIGSFNSSNNVQNGNLQLSPCNDHKIKMTDTAVNTLSKQDTNCNGTSQDVSRKIETCNTSDTVSTPDESPVNKVKNQFALELEKTLSKPKPAVLKPKPTVKPKPSVLKANSVPENGSIGAGNSSSMNAGIGNEEKRTEESIKNGLILTQNAESLSSYSSVVPKVPPPRPSCKPSVGRKPSVASSPSIDSKEVVGYGITNEEIKTYEHSSLKKKSNENKPRRSVSFALPQDVEARLKSQEEQESVEQKKPAVVVKPALPPPARPKAFSRHGVQIGQSQFYMGDGTSSSESTPASTPLEDSGVNTCVSAEPSSLSMFYRRLSSSDSSECAGPAAGVDDSPDKKVKKIPPRPSRPRSVSLVTHMSHSMTDGKPVPCRPAPPKPGMERGQSMSVVEQSSVSSESNDEVVEDLKRRISILRRDLKRCNEENERLRVALTEAEDHEKPDLIENIEFYKANMDGLSEELNTLTDNLYRLRPDLRAVGERRADRERKRVEAERRAVEETKRRETQRVRMRDTREKTIEELLQTESDYLQSLCLFLETVFSHESTKCPSCVDLEQLLGNIYEVVELSQKFHSMLEANTVGKSFEDQIIGSLFEELKEDLKRVYAIYCRNHNDAIALLEKYESIEEAQIYFNTLVTSMRQHATVFDIGSILIKPVQRIMKYPLLLGQLLKATEESHPDHKRLLSALNAMTDVAQAINEFKRRKDLVVKYKTTGPSTFTDMVSRVNMHSTKKKFSRFSMKMAGIQTMDENFSRAESRFHSLTSCMRSLINNIIHYVTSVQESLMSGELWTCDVVDLYSPDRIQECEQYCRVSKQLLCSSFAKFKAQVDGDVLRPLQSLQQMFNGPNNVIKKRHDKLLDYDSAALRFKSNRDSEQTKTLQDEAHMSRMTYEALNIQLLEDLPRLHTLSGRVLSDCLHQFLHVQQTFYMNINTEMKVLMQLNSLRSVDGLGITETFNMKHTEAVDNLSRLSFIPRSFNPLADEWKAQQSSVKSPNSLSSENVTPDVSSQLINKYGVDRVFMVSEDFKGTQLMDLQLAQGSLVGVLKEGDPMGNKNRYYVDSGAEKGFILKSYLVAYTPESRDSVVEMNVEPETSKTSVFYSCSNVESENMSQISQDYSYIGESQTDESRCVYEEEPYNEYNTETEGQYSVNESVQQSYEHSYEQPDEQTYEQTDEQTYEQTNEHSYVQTDQTDEQIYEQTDEQLDVNADGIYESSSEREGMGEVMSGDASNFYNDSNDSCQESPAHHNGDIQEDVYEAAYDFIANESSELELDLTVREIVTVLQYHDLNGNSDWWLVRRVDGKQGYVPANYLCRPQ